MPTDTIPSTPSSSPQSWNVALIAVNMFQLTEWVHNLITAAQDDLEAASQQVAEVYTRCLSWYKDFFRFIVPEGGRTSFVLFVQ